MEGETEREARRRIEEEEEEGQAQAQVDIWKYIFGFVEMAVVKCAIELGIPDVIENHDGHITLSDLSSKLGCSPPTLHRIMRFLIHRRIFKTSSSSSKEDNNNNSSIAYIHTPLSRLLTKNGKKSMAAFVLLESSPVMLEPWHGLSARVLAGGAPSFQAAHGKDVWSYAAVNPEHSKLINDAMACDAMVAVAAIIDGCPEIFEGVGSLVDVGGGDGTALGIVVKACPWIRGINFDLPHVVSVAKDCDGVEHVGGDMFDCVPNADAAFLMWVLHDWGDEECIEILRKCKEAIPQETGKVVIVEAVIKEEEEDKFKDVGLMLDMVMMAHTNQGKERSLKEWDYVLGKAGFTRHTVNNIQTVQSIIQAYP